MLCSCKKVLLFFHLPAMAKIAKSFTEFAGRDFIFENFCGAAPEEDADLQLF
jgi:hypothetical protein